MAMAMAMSNNRKSWRERRPLSEAEAGATTDASPEARWSAERLSGGEVFIRSQGQCGLTLSYAHPGRGGWRTLSVAKAETKREIAANKKEVKQIEDKGYKTNLTPTVDTRKNIIRPLCLLALSVLCWVFVCASFL